MIKLKNNNSDWKNWIVQINKTEYSLGEHGYEWGDDTYHFPGNSKEILSINVVSHLNLNEIPNQLLLDITNSDESLGKYVRSILLNSSSEKPYLGYTWEIDPLEWKGHLNPYLIRDMMFEILNSQTIYPLNINSESSISNDMDAATLYFDIKESAIKDFWVVKTKFSTFLNDSVKLAEEKVAIGGFVNKFVAKFEFDKNSQQAFSTYLLYFVEFLRDLGIETNGEFKRSNDSLIFSVTPKNKETGLIQISEALAFYLKLPHIDLNKISKLNYDPVVDLKFEKLKAEIERLKSSQSINEALLKYQDYLINARDTKPVNELKTNTPIDTLSYVYVDDEKQEQKTFLGGALKLGVMKKAGIEINWSALIGYFRSK